MVTDILPVDPVPTNTIILVGETTVKDVAAVPPKLNAVAPVKFVPVIVTVDPDAAVVGEKEVIVGDCMRVNPPNVAVPSGVKTDTFPDAPAPKTEVIIVEDTTVKDAAAVPPKLTAEVPVKLVPVRITVEPAIALDGLTEVIVGSRLDIDRFKIVVLLPAAL